MYSEFGCLLKKYACCYHNGLVLLSYSDSYLLSNQNKPKKIRWMQVTNNYAWQKKKANYFLLSKKKEKNEKERETVFSVAFFSISSK